MTGHPFEIRCTSGDVAYADDPVAALVAARTLCEDDAQARPYQGTDRTVSFHDSTGALIRAGVTRQFGAEEIIAALKNQPKEEEADLVVSTAHKSKGREWGSVQIAADFPEDRLAKGGDEAVDELRLLYVAVTRAKLELDITGIAFLVNGVPPSPEPVAVAARLPRPERAPAKRSEHVGVVGQDIVVEAGCVWAKGMTTKFGYTYLTQFLTAEGNVIKAFLDDELVSGAIYRLDARVREHGEFRGVAETTINYVEHEELSGAVDAPEAPVGVQVEA